MSRLFFFPTPYPDELFYSVLCRYHMRCGVPSTGITNREVGGFKVGQSIYLPQTVGRLSSMLPSEMGLTAEDVLKETTIFPYIKPFIPEERGRRATEILTSSEPNNLHNATGFSRLELPKWKHLRYCKECWKDDLRVYGEAYWHRLHLLPGVMVCPVHGTVISDSNLLIANLTREFHPASFALATLKVAEQYTRKLKEQLISLSEDSAWLLQNGYTLLSLENTLERYLVLLNIRGFLNLSRTKTKSKELDDALRDYYGDALLGLLEINSGERIPWSRKLFYRKGGLSNPLWHLLLMRFLAGSAEAFFMEQRQKLLPYGSGPWPCRNPVCEHHLENTITVIEEKYELSRFKATFKCPRCGFAYCRSNGGQTTLPPQSVRIYTVDYGWLWESMMMRHLKDGIPVMKIMELMHCGYRTVMEFGVANGFFPHERIPKKYFYGKQGKTDKAENLSDEDLGELYREQWKAAVATAPSASRSDLMRRFPLAYRWLRENDLQWYEMNSPSSRKSRMNWGEKDVKYLKQVTAAFDVMLAIPGKPLWITLRAMERYAGINNLYQLLKAERLPLTKTFLDSHIESRADWSKRKVRWAVECICGTGEQPCISAVQLMTGITPKVFDSFRDYANEQISQLLYCDDI